MIFEMYIRFGSKKSMLTNSAGMSHLTPFSDASRIDIYEFKGLDNVCSYPIRLGCGYKDFTNNEMSEILLMIMYIILL